MKQPDISGRAAEAQEAADKGKARRMTRQKTGVISTHSTELPHGPH